MSAKPNLERNDFTLTIEPFSPQEWQALTALCQESHFKKRFFWKMLILKGAEQISKE